MNRIYEQDNIYDNFESISENGKPICACGEEIVDWRYKQKRHRRKFRCSLKMGTIKSCPFSSTCSPSEYGRTIYLNESIDIRLFGPVPYNSDK